MRGPAGWVAAALVVGGLTAAPAAAEPYLLTVFGRLRYDAASRLSFGALAVPLS